MISDKLFQVNYPLNKLYYFIITANLNGTKQLFIVMFEVILMSGINLKCANDTINMTY